LADLASDPRFRGLPFLIIGAYRDNEVNNKHVLTIALEAMKSNSVRLYTIDVLPFTGLEMKHLLFDVLGGGDDIVEHATVLADLLLKKSQLNLNLYLEASCQYS